MEWKPERDGREMCPILENPEPDCYCVNLTSLNVQLAIQYCLRNFRECPIYKRCKGIP